ncbi:MAG TPA: threonine/serine dehydratase [Candidatus Polarisedimenticolia bacterium]|nr:threonine/serine dehydratase [Candidatus Polarisedimenticolia bacterium]
MTITLETVQSAARVVRGRIHRTPLIPSASLSRMTGHDLWLKAENLQKTGCFKPRGALNRLSKLSAAERARGVLAASAGNHAQGLAFAAADARIPVTVVMPANAQPSKIAATRATGAEVILHGTVFDEALARALELRETTGKVFVHPCTDPDVVSGAGTIGLEILEDLPGVDAIVAPIGGGGLTSGLAVAVKEQPQGRRVRIFGVEPEGAPSMKRSLEAGRRVVLDSARSIADGMTGRAVFDETLEYARRYLDDVVLVSDEAILRAMTLMLTRCKMLAEGAGAGPVAAALEGLPALPPGSKVVAVVSGGNQDLDLLARWLSKGLPTA